MELSLGPSDLKPEYKDIPTSQTDYWCFDEEVQKAIVVVGKAMFYRLKGGPNENYNAIYPPEN